MDSYASELWACMSLSVATYPWRLNPSMRGWVLGEGGIPWSVVELAASVLRVSGPGRWVGIARQDCSYEPEPTIAASMTLTLLTL